jgi:DNA-directed RNA polymerase subunit H (RpoH/RPB5)
MYRVFCTVAQMVVDRGYLIRRPEALKSFSDSTEAPMTFSEFKRAFVKLNEVEKAPGGGEDVGSDGAAPPVMIEEVDRDAIRFHCKKPITVEATTAAAEVEDAGRPSSSGEQPSAGVMVFFSQEDHVTVNGVLQLRHTAMKKKATSMIVVCQGKVFPSVKRDLEEISGRLSAETGEALMHIQLLEEDDLVFNFTHHETVPKHIPLDAQEAELFLKEKGLQVAQLPRMKKDDPIALYFGLQRGCIVRIERESELCGLYDMYRQII